MRYFSFDQKDAILAYIRGLGPDASVKVAGHGWGGDTSMRVADALPKDRIGMVITIDPAGGGGANLFCSVADHARRRIDVTSEGGGRFAFETFLARDPAALDGGEAYGRSQENTRETSYYRIRRTANSTQ